MMDGKQKKTTDFPESKSRPNARERLPIVLRGLQEGKSSRRIADELGCDEGTVRRDLRKLALPAEQQAAIQKGDSAEKYLNAALLQETGIDWSARNKIRRRRRDDEKDGKHSDLLGRALLGWLSTKELTNENIKLVLKDATGWSESLPDGQPKANGKFGEVVAPVERDRNVDRRLTMPEPNFIQRCAAELVRALVQVEPVQVIRQSALEKATKSVLARGHWMDRPEWQAERANIARRRNLRGGK